MKKLIPLLLVLFILSCSEDTPLPLENTHTLITSASPPEGGSISPATGEHNEGVYSDVTATPSNGYVFVGWTWGGIVTENTLYPSTTVIMDNDYEVTANFEIQ
jgi:hypothetical protein